MNKISFITALILVSFFTIKTTNAADDRKIVESEKTAINKFAWELFRQSFTKRLSNYILCPLAVQYQLLLLELGAAGETKEQLQNITGRGVNNLMNIHKLLNSQDRSVDSPKVLSAIGLYMSNRLKLNVTFQKMIEKDGGEIYNVDFASKSAETKKSINEWVSLNTNGEIQDFLTSDVSSLDMLLASGLYFQGQWQKHFNSTGQQEFHTSSNEVVMTDVMEIVQNFNFERLKFGDGIELIELPYKGNDYSMILLVPTTNIPLDDVLKIISAEDFDSIMKKNNERNSIRIRLVMPKFQISSRFSVVTALLKMGLTSLFTKLSSLPYLTQNSESFSVSDIFQKATLKVDEGGTIASAATSSSIIPLSADNKHEIVIDRPFISIIFDRKNQCPLFLTKVLNPTVP